MSEEKANITVAKHLESLKPIEIASSEKVAKKFIELYDTIHGKGRGEAMYQKERFNFEKLYQENPALQECTKLSSYGCFLDIAVNGLSLDPNKPLCYIIPRSCKSGRKDPATGKDIYEKRAAVSVTGPGELVMRMRSGQIRYADNPVIVYEGDIFTAKLGSNGLKTITYEACIPRKSNKIIAAFIRIVRNDGSVDYQWLLENDIDRLKSYSAKSNSYYNKSGQKVTGDPNALYSSLNGGIDSGFLENKMIKHAFDSYPKVRTGEFTQLESHVEPEPINYGIEEQSTIEETTAQDVTNEPENGSFDSAPAPQQGTVTFEEDGGSF